MSDLVHATVFCTVLRKPSVIETDVDGELVLLDTEGGACCGLNGIASHIWNLLASPIRVSALCEKLTSEFDVASNECEAQVIDLLNTMRGEGLIRLVDQA